MMRFSIAGGAVALVVAALTKRPVLVTAAGIGIAALLGGLHGHLAVQSGSAEHTIVCDATTRWGGQGDSMGPFLGWPESPRCDSP